MQVDDFGYLEVRSNEPSFWETEKRSTGNKRERNDPHYQLTMFRNDQT